LVRIAILGAGGIGGNAARLWSRAGHDLVMCLSRHPDRDRSTARNAGTAATEAIIMTQGIQRTERGHGCRLGEEVTQ
jgi:predicted dinucleotide-binding enzyme